MVVINKLLHAALQARRWRLGLDQGQLARKIGRSNATMSTWEAGTAVPNWHLFQRWVTALGLRIVIEERKGEEWHPVYIYDGSGE